MSYIRLDADKANATWEQSDVYTAPVYDSVDVEFTQGVDGLATIGDTVDYEMYGTATRSETSIGDSVEHDVTNAHTTIGSDPTWEETEEITRQPYTYVEFSFGEMEGILANIIESMLIDSVFNGFTLNALIENTINCTDVVQAINANRAVIEFITDYVVGYDWPARFYAGNQSVEDIVLLLTSDSITLNGTTYHAVDIISNMDLLSEFLNIKNRLAFLSDSLTAEETHDVTTRVSKIVTDTLDLVVDVNTNAILNRTVLQNLSISIKESISWPKIASEIIDLSTTILVTPRILRTVFAKTSIGDSVSNKAQLVAAIALVIALDGLFSSGSGADITDEVEMSAEQKEMLLGVLNIINEIIIEDTADLSCSISVTGLSSVQMQEELSINQVLLDAITDGISFAISFGLDGNVYTGVSMNTKTNAASIYKSYPFNSFIKLSGKNYGANSIGLYLLEGNTDDGEHIYADIKLGSMDFTGDRKALLHECWISLRSDGSLILSTISDDNKERLYTMSSTGDILKDKRVRLARGVNSRYWEFRLRNINGADFELIGLDAVPFVLKRR